MRNKENDLARVHRREQVVTLKFEGKTYPEIAEAVGCSMSTAHADVKAEIKRRVAKLGETIDEMRILEMVELEQLERALATKMSDGSIGFDSYVKGLLAMLKLKERKSRLFGLDLGSEPDKVLALSINVTPDANVPLRATFVENLARSVGHPPTANDVLNDLRVKRLPEKIVDGNGRGGNGKIGG